MPPNVVPREGVMLEIVARAGATKVNALERVTCPAGVVRTRATEPGGRTGVVMVTLVEVAERIVAAVPPKVTEEVSARFVPLIVTAVPPSVEPDVVPNDVIVAGA